MADILKTYLENDKEIMLEWSWEDAEDKLELMLDCNFPWTIGYYLDHFYVYDRTVQPKDWARFLMQRDMAAYKTPWRTI